MTVRDEELDAIIHLVTERTGIVPRASHREGIRTYIKKELDALKLSVREYTDLLRIGGAPFTELVNESTVNETYFFREERQFVFLRDKLFPLWRSSFGSRPVSIWSAACSTGAEAYSLALLAQACGVRANIIASDINTDVLRRCSLGIFRPMSVRQGDGAQFHHLLAPYRQMDGSIMFDNGVRGAISTRRINLSEIDAPAMSVMLPKNQNIVFLRNVFIYFGMDLRARILRTITERCLCDGGYLFVSMSEIAQVDASLMPRGLEKTADGSVFYFHKKDGGL